MAKTVADVLAAARGQLGYNGGGTPDAPVTAFGAWFGVQTQWCAEFVSWCLAAAGVDRLGRWPKGEDYCPAWVDSFRAHGRWKTSNPQPGDVVFYSWNRNGVADHVGLVESVPGAGSIITIEGNTDDPTMPAYTQGNCCRRKHRTTYYVLGYGTPPYATGESTSSGSSHPVQTPGTKPGTNTQEDHELNGLTPDQAKQLDELHAVFYDKRFGRLAKLDGLLYAVTNPDGYLKVMASAVTDVLGRIAKKLGA